MLKGHEKCFAEWNPPQSWPWKQNGNTVVAAAMILAKKPVTDKYFEKKLGFEPKSSSVTGKVCYHYNSWLTGVVYMAYMFDRNSERKTPQTEW